MGEPKEQGGPNKEGGTKGGGGDQKREGDRMRRGETKRQMGDQESNREPKAGTNQCLLEDGGGSCRC